VFAPSSPRALEPNTAEALLADVVTEPAGRVGVFQDQPVQFINQVVRRCRLDLVQLHGHEARDLPGGIVVPVLRMVPVPATTPAEPLQPRSLAPNVFGVLLDTAALDGASGGRGIAADPAALATVIAALATETRVFLAGGLVPENVAERIRRFAPFAVDVSSGIEHSPGVKDPARMAAFVAAVRSAAWGVTPR